ncbi:MAG: replication-associated recombination protein A [Lachnospira sp.]|nr:replication-associated recombination protein A [Lachnospira sp.]
MDLFDYMRENTMKNESPLASRIRPVTLDEVVGQQHIIGKDKLLYRAIQADKLSSIIFYGPPGTGKTTLAKVIANTTSADFKQINATVAGKKDMEEIVEQAKNSLGMYGKKTILFVDEIHRFNKGQQDYLLPFVEDGTVVLIGATTENPYFEVNGALLSRSIIFELKPLEKEDIKVILKRAVYDEKKGMGSLNADIDDEALEFLADISNGDARSALNAIELGVLTTKPSEDGKIHITLKIAEQCIQKRAIKYDKSGDNHYDTISAFIKSMRGSDPDAATYYLARMLYAGEDIKFIARRIMICASEDVGNADPQALVVATNAALAVERIGMPEAQIILSQAVNYVACAPKSNASTNAIFGALDVVKNEKTYAVPMHLRDAHYGGAGKLGHGVGYKYAHDYKNHYVTQQYLPDELVGRVFYEPTDNGYEKMMKEHMERIKSEAETI